MSAEVSMEAVNEAALALYKLDHPTFDGDTFERVPLLATVTHYRHRAWVAVTVYQERTQPSEPEQSS